MSSNGYFQSSSLAVFRGICREPVIPSVEGVSKKSLEVVTAGGNAQTLIVMGRCCTVVQFIICENIVLVLLFLGAHRKHSHKKSDNETCNSAELTATGLFRNDTSLSFLLPLLPSNLSPRPSEGLFCYSSCACLSRSSIPICLPSADNLSRSLSCRSNVCV